ncbi:MAG: NAD(P)/FAD-dependent oxidoreductase [Bosea sp. (in: a-proteobacteria)]
MASASEAPAHQTDAGIAVIGAGPAGLIAAQKLAEAGHRVTVFDRMPSPGRKFLLAGRGGLNLTHSEGLPAFIARYGAAQAWLKDAISAFPPDTLRKWSETHGEPTFVGSSGRVFPQSFKASPLLRSWLRNLASLGVTLQLGQRWLGWTADGQLRFRTTAGEESQFQVAATLLALGGASWPRMGSDGAWTELLAARGIKIRPLLPANCGFELSWSDLHRERFAGTPLKRIALSFGEAQSRGDLMMTEAGIEGGAVYGLSGPLRDAILREGHATAILDLRPDVMLDELATQIARPRGSLSQSNHLRKVAGLSPVALSILREALAGPLPQEPEMLAAAIKSAPLRLTGISPIARAISSAGGIAASELDVHFMLKALPGVFAAGEMLDWEAPTGGYLLQASFATGVAVAAGISAWLRQQAA